MRAIARSRIDSMRRPAVRAFFQIIPYDGTLIRLDTVPWDERFTVNSCESKAELRAPHSDLLILTCYLEP